LGEGKGRWNVDTTAVLVAVSATAALCGASTTVELGGVTMASDIGGPSGGGANLAKVVADRFGIQLDMSAGVDHSATVISGDIYLNATEEAITQLLGSGVEEKAYDFGFYTKVDLKAVGGDVTVNVNLQQQPGGNTFKLDFTDLDVSVESFHNVVGVDATPAAGIISSSAAGEFVHMDSEQDIALGNGGNDTYVVGANASGIYGGTALEYGNIGTGGGLANSESDAVNFNSVNSVSDLIFERKQVRNEADGNSLSIKDSVDGNETILFDNYNTYLDFRRVEYLTVEDGANNDEVYEIVTNTNLGVWDNEIYVADGGTTDIKLGGHDYIVGSSKADTFKFSLGDIVGSADAEGTIDLLQLGSGDAITFTDPGSDLTTADGTSLNNLLQASVASGGQIKFDFDYDYEGASGEDDKLTVTYDSDPSNITIDQELIFII
jgi:hypothetical protein